MQNANGCSLLTVSLLSHVLNQSDRELLIYLLNQKTPVPRMKMGLIPSHQTCLTGLMPRKPRFVSRVKRHVSEQKQLNSGKPRLACPVASEAYLTRVGEELQIPVGAHSCAMNSRLKAAPTIILSEREMLRFSWVRT